MDLGRNQAFRVRHHQKRQTFLGHFCRGRHQNHQTMRRVLLFVEKNAFGWREEKVAPAQKEPPLVRPQQ